MFVLPEGNGQCADFALPSVDVEDEEDAMEWFVEEVLGSHPSSHGEGKADTAKVCIM